MSAAVSFDDAWGSSVFGAAPAGAPTTREGIGELELAPARAGGARSRHRSSARRVSLEPPGGGGEPEESACGDSPPPVTRRAPPPPAPSAPPRASPSEIQRELRELRLAVEEHAFFQRLALYVALAVVVLLLALLAQLSHRLSNATSALLWFARAQQAPLGTPGGVFVTSPCDASVYSSLASPPF